MPFHGNENIRSGRGKAFDELIRDDLDKFFEVMELLSEPQSTRIVRHATGCSLRDDLEGVTYLPTHMSKRGLYTRFCNERGWELERHKKGDYNATVVNDDFLPICSWYKFRSFWKQHYPKLRIGRSSEDVCTACHIFHNKMKYKMRQKDDAVKRSIRDNVVNDDTDDDEDTDDNDEDSDNDDNVNTVPAVVVDDDANAETPGMLLEACRSRAMEEVIIEEFVYEFNDIVQGARLHVEQAKDQRELSNEKIEQAIADQSDGGKLHSECVRTLVMDYSQNADLPQLGANQPGKSYYLSPLSIYIFGIVDAGIKGGVLDAYVYPEHQGGKEGDNVASMLYLYLKKKGWLELGNQGKELNVIMDNCSGQNKNNCVLRLGALLVEVGYFKEVNFIFYVVGHTKNACDRWFNTLKRVYRVTDIWTFDQLIEKLKTHHLININKIERGDFKEFRKFEDQYYNVITSGKLLSGHIFTVNCLNPTTMTILQDRLGTAPPHVQDLKKSTIGIPLLMTNYDRVEDLSILSGIEEVPYPGLKPIKQIEMYKKWRDIVPIEYWEEICPKPSDELLKTHNKELNAKRAKKYAAKKKRKAPTAAPVVPTIAVEQNEHLMQQL